MLFYFQPPSSAATTRTAPSSPRPRDWIGSSANLAPRREGKVPGWWTCSIASYTIHRRPSTWCKKSTSRYIHVLEQCLYHTFYTICLLFSGDHFPAWEIRPRPQGLGHPVQPLRRQRRRCEIVAEQHCRLSAPGKESASSHCGRWLRGKVQLIFNMLIYFSINLFQFKGKLIYCVDISLVPVPICLSATSSTLPCTPNGITRSPSTT